MRWLAALLGVALIACGGSHPEAKDASSDDVTPAEQHALVAADKLGRAIYLQDVAAARATDAMLAMTEGQPDPHVRGWVTLETNWGYRVQFVAPSDAGLLVLYEVDVPRWGGKVRTRTLRPPEPASTEAELQFRAREAVLKWGFRSCSRTYNTVVLPGELLGQRGHLVYALAATTDPGKLVIGGHHRFLVSEDGTTVLAELPLSKDCMTLERREDAVGITVSSLVQPVPNEGHYFVSLLYGMPLHVSAGGRLWSVDPGKRSKRSLPSAP